MAKTNDAAPFGDGLKYPFNQFARLFNFYWVLIPIVGLLAILGYTLNIMRDLVNGKTQELPSFGSFGDNLKNGFFYFLHMLPLMIGLWILMFIAAFIPLLPILLYIVVMLVLPPLAINYAMKREFSALYAFQWSFNLVFNNFGDYIVALLKTIGFMVVMMVASILIVTLIVTYPAMAFGQNYYLADFYRRHQK